MYVPVEALISVSVDCPIVPPASGDARRVDGEEDEML
jgi:hypothetical protein